MALVPVTLDEVPASAGVSLIATARTDSYRRPMPKLIDAEIVDPNDLAHLMRVFTDAEQAVMGMRLYELPDAVTFSTGEVVIDGRYLLVESILHSRPHNSGATRLIDEALAVAEKRFTMSPGERCDRGLLLNQWSPRNYGHFLVEILPKVGFARERADLGETDLLVNRGITGAIGAVYRECLDRSGYKRGLVPVPAQMQVERLLFVTTAGIHGINKYAPAIQYVRSLFLSGEEKPCPPRNGRRLWVLRKEEYKRRLTNQAELVEMARSFGYEVVVPEAMSVAEQAATFAEASACIGPIGAGLSNIMFCWPGTPVITLCPNFGRETFFYDIASIIGAPYTYLFGPATDPSLRFNSDYSVDPARLHSALEELHG